MGVDCQRQLKLLEKEVRSLEKVDFNSFVTLIKKYQNSKSQPTESEITKVVRHVRLAVTHLQHKDPHVRKRAGKVLDSCRHSFSQLQRSTRPFVRALKHAASREEDSRRLPRLIDLGDGYHVMEVTTMAKLMALGMTFDNCLKNRDTAKDYLQSAINGTSTIQALYKHGELMAMFRINLDDAQIEEFDTKVDVNHLRDHIPRELMNDILEVFSVSGDEIFEFVQCGAFKCFVHGEPDIEPILCDGIEWWVYFYGNELIIGVDQDSNGQLYWSRFTKVVEHYGDIGYWDDSRFNHLRVENLFEAVRRYPQLLKEMQISLTTDYQNYQKRLKPGHHGLPMRRGARLVRIDGCIRSGND